MPRKTIYPKYLLHKSSGQAYTYHRLIDAPSHRIYLGKYGSPESHAKFQEIVKRLNIGLTPKPPASPTRKLSRQPSIAELIKAYVVFARKYYARPDGPTGDMSREFSDMQWTLSVLHAHHRTVHGADYGPHLLKELRMTLIDQDYARSYINKTIGRIKRFFRWACSEQLIPATVIGGLETVQYLKRGEYGVRESTPVTPAPYDLVEKLLPWVSPVIGDMLRVQYLCAMRPIEVCLMRPCDIDRSRDIWLYTPMTHKTARFGKTLVKAIPVEAQSTIAPRLDRDPAAFLFQPTEALQWMYANRAMATRERKTKRYPSEIKRLERLRIERAQTARRRHVRDRYNAGSYYHGMQYGLKRAEKAGVTLTKFFPLQLRHAIVTFVSSRFGSQKAQRYAGHESLDTTMIYTEKDIAEMIEVARQLDALWRSA